MLALGQSLDCHSASEVSLIDMGKSDHVEPQQSTAKQKPCAYFLGYTVCIRGWHKHIKDIYAPPLAAYKRTLYVIKAKNVG